MYKIDKFITNYYYVVIDVNIVFLHQMLSLSINDANAIIK